MSNHSIPIVDKHNLTETERARLINRQMGRNYRADHREAYRKYQREYKARNKNRPSVLHHSLKNKIIRLHNLIEELKDSPTKIDVQRVRYAVAQLARLKAQLIELNYQEINTDPKALTVCFS